MIQVATILTLILFIGNANPCNFYSRAMREYYCPKKETVWLSGLKKPPNLIYIHT